MRNEQGAIIVLVTMMMPLLIALSGLAIDYANVWSARARAQSAADAAALAAAQELVGGTASQITAEGTSANTYANAYVSGTSAVRANDAGATVTVTAPYGSDGDAALVTVTKYVPTFFTDLLGIKGTTVTATAVATNSIAPTGGFLGQVTAAQQSSGNNVQSTQNGGWYSFCAADSDSYTSGTGAKVATCPTNVSATLGSWNVVHGGIDISSTNFYDPTGTTDTMIDLTGTCNEASGTYPGGRTDANGKTSDGGYDGYCQNNADGEIEAAIPTIVGQTYTVHFYMGANTWGAPYQKPMLVLASSTNLSNLPAVADTNGSDSASASSNPYGTTYPLAIAGDLSNGSLLAWEEFYDYSAYSTATNSSDSNPTWNYDTFTFSALSSTTYLGFASLINCQPDWYTATSLPQTVTSGSNSSTTWTAPSPQVDDYQNESGQSWQDECEYGPGVADVTVIGANSTWLSK